MLFKFSNTAKKKKCIKCPKKADSSPTNIPLLINILYYVISMGMKLYLQLSETISGIPEHIYMSDIYQRNCYGRMEEK